MMMAANGDATMQMQCLGVGEYLSCHMLNLTDYGLLVFTYHLVNCTKYHGPHLMNCLQTMWYQSNCLYQGHMHPPNMSALQLGHTNSINLLYVFASAVF